MNYRLFLAIPLSSEHIHNISGLSKSSEIKGVRWTKEENLHITLLFLSNIREEDLSSLISKLKDLEKNESFNLEFENLIFAPPGQIPPRMIWLKLKNSAFFDRLAINAYHLSKAFTKIDQPRRNSIHITLARLKPYANWKKVNLSNFKLETIRVKKIELISSTLTPQGPIYSKMAEFKLN